MATGKNGIMTFSFGPKGGIQDPEILKLLAELTTLVKTHGNGSPEVTSFIDKNKDIIVVDELSQHMHTFKEIAEPMAMLIQGIKNPHADKLPGDGWETGSAEKIFDEKDPDEPADWWKK